jgi:hypothetical protein
MAALLGLEIPIDIGCATRIFLSLKFDSRCVAYDIPIEVIYMR